MPSNYLRAGITDVRAFYADKFVAATHGQRFFDDPLNRYHIDYARFAWFDRHIRPGSRVLDFGCGAGSLAFLTGKGCELCGIELSATGARRAEAAGYERVFVGDLAAADFAAASFDYVVSEDVLGHIEFDQKDAVISGLKALLRPGGVMLHAIESDDVDYDAMSDEELRDFVTVDGHVGMETRERLLERFGRFFAHVDGEVRFVHTRPWDTILKGVLEYDQQNVDPPLLEYLRHLQPSEQFAFNTAMGMVFASLERCRVPSRSDMGGGLMMLRCSDLPLPEQDFAHPRAPQRAFRPGETVPLDADCFATGWYQVERNGDSTARWTMRRAVLSVPVTADTTRLWIEFRLPPGDGETGFRFTPEGGAPVSGRGRAGGPLRVAVDRPRGAARIVVRLETDRVHIPTWSGGADPRVLGLQVIGLLVE